MLMAPGRSFSRRIVRRTRSWATQATPRPPHAPRSARATVLLPEPELPRMTISRVLSDPVATWLILERPRASGWPAAGGRRPDGIFAARAWTGRLHLDEQVRRPADAGPARRAPRGPGASHPRPSRRGA